MYPTPRSHRALIMGRNGAVGANHPMAAQAGLDILRAGGNAVDASVAVALALGVCEPMMSGLGPCPPPHGGVLGGGRAAPAIVLARDGFAATHGYRYFTAENKPRLAADPRSGQTFLGHELAGVVLQPDLARTLGEIAADGAETFYRGRLAVRLARGMREAGILVTEADLAAFQP